VIVGAVITWIGVCLQLRHDSKEREKERQQTIRQKTYLFGAEQIGKLLEYVANFYDVTEAGPREYTTAMEQINIIGSDETIKAANALNDHMVQALYELIPEKQEINFLQQELKGLQESMQKKQKEIDKNLEEMKEYNLQGKVDTRKWAVIQANYKSADGQLQEILDELKSGCEKQLVLINELAGKCFHKAQRAEELLIPFIIAVRKELNAPFDEQTFQNMMKVSHEKWEDNVEVYRASMQDKFEQLFKKATPPS
jgi:hypothetical protein